MKGLPDFNPADRRFWPDRPDAGFSPERNNSVINGVIKKYEARRVKKMKEFKKGLAERTDAVTTYLTGNYGAQRSTPIQRYFSKRYLAYLRGQDIVDSLKINSSIPSNLGYKVWNGEGRYLGGAKQK